MSIELIRRVQRFREGANKSLGTKTHHSKLLILNG